MPCTCVCARIYVCLYNKVFFGLLYYFSEIFLLECRRLYKFVVFGTKVQGQLGSTSPADHRPT